jgi:hypothetical protein
MMRTDDDGGTNSRGTQSGLSKGRSAVKAAPVPVKPGDSKKTVGSTGAGSASHQGDWNSTMGAKITRD